MTEEEQKRKEWEELYDDVIDWEEFEENYYQCNLCGSYEDIRDGGCVCYAR